MRLAAALAVAFLASHSAEACRCSVPGPEPEDAFESEEIVFVGTAVVIDSFLVSSPRSDVPDWYNHLLGFEVEEYFKYPHTLDRGQRLRLTTEPGVFCTRSFTAGKRYVVFAYVTPSGIVSASQCGASTEASPEVLARVRSAAASWRAPRSGREPSREMGAAPREDRSAPPPLSVPSDAEIPRSFSAVSLWTGLWLGVFLFLAVSVGLGTWAWRGASGG